MVAAGQSMENCQRAANEPALTLTSEPQKYGLANDDSEQHGEDEKAELEASVHAKISKELMEFTTVRNKPQCP